MIHSSINYDLEPETVFSNCQDHQNTVLIIKTNYGNIIGGISKILWEKMDKELYDVPAQSTCIFYYDGH